MKLMSELERKIEELRSRNADLVEILEAVERESGWVPKDTPMPVYIGEMRKALAEEKKWSEELAKDLCEMEDALGFKQDCTDKDGAFVPTKGPWKERVRDLIAKEGEFEDMRKERDAAQKACAELREAIESLWAHCDLKAFGGSKPKWLIHALSDECGKGYIHRDEVKPLVEALRFILDECTWQNVMDDGGDDRIGPTCEKALAHWRKEEK